MDDFTIKHLVQWLLSNLFYSNDPDKQFKAFALIYDYIFRNPEIMEYDWSWSRIYRLATEETT